MPIYKQTTEITKIDDVWANIDRDIVEVYFGDKNIFTVWGEYDGSLPITINANGDALLDYRIYGADGGVGEQTENLINASLSEQTIEIKPSTQYNISRYDGNYYSDGLSFGIYDENNDLLWSDYLGTWKGENLSVFGNAKYFKIKIPNSCLNAVSLIEGERPAGMGREPYPANYIPYGYKLPMTVGDGNTVQTVPIYIGSELLGEDEYVDYAEGKIYHKNPANYFDGYFELGAIDYNTGAEIPSNSSIRTDFIELEPSNKYYVKWATGDLYILPVSYDENKNYVKYLGAKTSNPSYFEVGANEKYIRFYLYNTTTPPKEMMVCKNADAPYYDPQDPPVPLPDIPTIDGETVIDYDGDPKPSQMYIKYRKQHS